MTSKRRVVIMSRPAELRAGISFIKRSRLMRKLSACLVVFVLLAGSIAEAGVKVVTTWKDPAAGAPKFSKIVIAFPTTNTSLRQRVESGLARRIPRSVAAHTFVPDSELGDHDAIKNRLASNQVDGVILLKLLD